MPDFFVTGKKGNGKSLSMLDLIYRCVQEGRVVATNLDLYLDKLFLPQNKTARIMRVPDKPKSADLELIGLGNKTLNEDMNGVLILDELATWMNSRTFNDSDRQELINWLVLARKKGWDVYYLVQDLSMADKQAREGLAEHVVYCRRLDRINVPVVGRVFKLFFGSRLTFPRLHVAVVKYGTDKNALKVDTWTYRGEKYFNAYNTRQQFRSDYPHGVYSYLPPYFLTYRSFSPRTGAFYMRLTKIYFKRVSHVVAFAAGVFFVLAASTGWLVLNGDLQADVLDAQLVTAIAEPTEEEKAFIKSLKIVSYSNLPGRVPVYYLKNEEEKITSKNLIDRGFKVLPYSKNIIIVTKGEFYEKVYGI